MKRLIFCILFSFALSFTCFADELDVAEMDSNPYATIELTDDERFMMICNAWWACAEDACTDDTVFAVYETVLNRYLSGEWKSSVAEILNQYDQFEYGTYKSCRSLPNRCTADTRNHYYELLDIVLQDGPQVLPSINYQYYATKKQSLGKNHVWIGQVKEDGSPRKKHGMYFCEKR